MPLELQVTGLPVAFICCTLQARPSRKCAHELLCIVYCCNTIRHMQTAAAVLRGAGRVPGCARPGFLR